MRDYIDLVLCETCTGKREVFKAPRFSHLNEGDMVIVESGEGEEMTNVISSVSISTEESEELTFIKATMNISDIKDLDRIKSRVVFRKFEYEEEEENGNL